MDIKENGKIFFEDFEQLVKEFNFKFINPLTLKQIFIHLDHDNDGAITFNDYIKTLQSV